MALGMFIVYVAVALVWRSAVHRRSQGDSGSRLAATTPTGKVAAGLITSAHVVVVLGVVLQGTPAPPAVAVASAVAFAAGLLLVARAQTTMGESWRVGTDPDEWTALVTRGLFGVVRNPIFSGMAVCLVAIAASATSWVAAAGVVLFVAAIEMQVRLVEEPALERLHGASFADYRRTTGRFIPRAGWVSGPRSA
jgi:protein-S-isoprenylcysteine O-methyltransferase Ste14